MRPCFRNIGLLVFLLIFGLGSFSTTYGQFSYIGRTINLVTGEVESNVPILHKRLGEVIYSDDNGAFIWDFGDISDHDYRIINNIFYTPPSENVSLQLYSIDGKKVIETSQLGVGSTYLFTNLNDGWYVLRINSSEKTTTCKILSSSYKVSLMQNLSKEKSLNGSQKRDTLIFSKPDYFTQEVSLPRSDTTFVAKILPKESNIDFLLGIPNYEVYSLLQGSPFVTNQGEVESVKFIYDENQQSVYFMNTKRHNWHFVFAKDFLNYAKGNTHFNMTQYTDSDERYLYPGSINYYKSLDKYVLRFYPGDEMGCSKIQEIINKIVSVSYLQGKLYLYPNNTKWESCSDVPLIYSDELYEGQNYQALNLAKGIGYLQKVELEKLETSHVGKHDIILLNGIPNDVSVVAGIITTEFQTPLSHINILSHNRETPNMALRNGWTNEQLNSLLGKLVYLEVQADSFIIRTATIDEATAFWIKNEPQTIITLAKNTTTSGLINLETVGYNDVNLVGGKAANFAEMLKIHNPTIPCPENPFAIPFYYYNEHINSNGIFAFMEELFADENFKINQEYRKEKLSELRNKIKEAPINNELIELVSQKINYFNDFESYRFRSSTNAEDLEFFTGAGLYDSYSAKKDHETKTIEKAIKKVWASLWNFRAFEEREYYKIDHLSAAMGILVHRSFPDEDANGVLITKNLYNSNPGFILNTQFKEYSIVFPEPGVLHDQIILFTYSVDYSRNFTIEYLSRSNIPELNGKTVLTDEELYQLGEYCMEIKKHFFYNVPHQCNCLFDDFGLDIEFKVDSPNGNRQLYIKQVRIYN